jgi:hypothetical protein
MQMAKKRKSLLKSRIPADAVAGGPEALEVIPV